jgi:hypothetical protein
VGPSARQALARAIGGSACLLALVACGRNALDVAATSDGAAGRRGGVAGAGGSSGASSGSGGGAAGGGGISPGGGGGAAGGALGGSPGTAGAPDAGVVLGLKQIGETCAEGIDCRSSFCANGVCCAMACDGACWSCAIAGSVGSCEPLHAASPCALARCDGNNLTQASTCDGQGTCQPTPLVVCAPFACDAQAAACSATCTSDADCFDTTCVNGSCGPIGRTAICLSNDDCASGFCSDGVCCNVACEGGCVSCALPNRIGTCTPVEAGNLDPRGVCADQGVASCGTNGRCDGNGGCGLYPANALCAPPTCLGATLTSARFCDGLGMCLPPSQSLSCAPFMCRGDLAQCAADSCPGGDAICIAGAYCSGDEVCAQRKAGGAPCGSDHECVSFSCVAADGGAPVCGP